MLQFPKSQIKIYLALVAFSIDVANDVNKMATPLGSQTSILEEFILQSNEVVANAIVDTLVIEFNRKSMKNYFVLTLSPINLREPSMQQGRSFHLPHEKKHTPTPIKRQATSE